MSCSGTNKCSIEIGKLPLLLGCPGAGEWVFFGNANGGKTQYKYARRLWSDLVNCITASIPTTKYIDITFVVGQASTNPLFNDGQTSFSFNIGVNSVFDTTVGNCNLIVSVDQSLNPRNTNEYISENYVSWNVAYVSATGIVTISFNQAASNGQLYQIHGSYQSV